MIFSHKKPASVASLIGNPSAFQAARQWAAEWQSGARMPPLLVWGPTGTGKTALAHAIAAEYGWELFEFNASDLRDEEAVSGLLSHALSSTSLFGNRRLILIDDVDALSGTLDRGGAGAIAKALSAAQQPAILTALNFYDRKLQAIRTHCTPVELRRVQSGTIAALLRKLAAQSGLELSQEKIEKISQSASGDVRAALNDLQGGNTSARRDSEKSVFEVVRTILKSEKYAESRAAAFSSETERDTLKWWVAHNLPLEYDRPFDLAEAYNSLSRADIFDGRVKRMQYWGYLRYSSDLMSAGVSVAKTAQYKKYTQLSYPDYIRQMGASKSGRALRRAVLQKVAACCHCSLAQAASYLPILSATAKKEPSPLAETFRLEEEELEFLSGKPQKKAARATAKKAAKK